MHEALASEEYQLYLQPRMNLHTGHIDGAEALVRWKPRDHSMLMPNQFIPLFAANGFCAQLDLYMVERFNVVIGQSLGNLKDQSRGGCDSVR